MALLEQRSGRVVPAPPVLLGVGLLALLGGTVVTVVSPLLTALVVGALVANSRLRSMLAADAERVTRLLLRAGVVLLGFRLQLGDLVGIGPRAVVLVVVVVAVTYLGTCWIGDRWGLDRGLVTLIAAGCAVCGAAAIATIEGGIRRRTEDVALAIALVTVFGSVGLVALPLAAEALGMTDLQAGVWVGASLHEVAHVVVAASLVGSGAVAVAMTIKLGRVAMLAGVYAVSRRRTADAPAGSEQPHGPVVPWFVLGFLAAAAVRSTGALPTPALDLADLAATVLLAAAMCGLGLGLELRRLLPVPLAAVGLATAATALAVGTGLLGSLLLF